MTVPTLMPNEELKAWILRRLGSPLLKVELTNEHLEDAVEEARRWFAAKKGVKKSTNLNFYSGQPDYDLPDEVDTVLDVVFPESAADLTLIFSPYLMIDEKVPYDVFAAPNSAGLYSTFTQTLQFVEMAKRILGADAMWLQEGRKLWLFPTPRSAGRIGLDYTSRVFATESLSERDHDMLKRYALALAKTDLGHIRRKYSNFPGAQGPVELDGQSLLDEAKDEIEKLNEEIALSGYPMPFIVG